MNCVTYTFMVSFDHKGQIIIIIYIAIKFIRSLIYLFVTCHISFIINVKALWKMIPLGIHPHTRTHVNRHHQYRHAIVFIASHHRSDTCRKRIKRHQWKVIMHVSSPRTCYRHRQTHLKKGIRDDKTYSKKPYAKKRSRTADHYIYLYWDFFVGFLLVHV